LHSRAWGTEFSHLSKECQERVRRFSTAQLALSQELLVAKPLGICKTSIYGINELNSKNPILTSISGKKGIRLDTSGRNDLKETFL